MDTEGYLPIAFLCNFPDVMCYGADYMDIMKKLTEDEKFEVDVENETFRVKDYKKVLIFPLAICVMLLVAHA